MKLTIAIPTYNRNEILKNHIGFLLPQITDECKLLIIDNCSGISVQETLGDLIAGYPSVDFKIVRNKMNIGGNANIVRCFELCDTEWIWVLGDDDVPEPKAIETILRNIHSNHDTTNFNYYSPDRYHPVRNMTFVSHGLDDYLAKMDSFNESIFISTNIYRRPDVINSIAYAILFQYSCAPQFVILVMSLRADKECIFSKEVIVKNNSENTPKTELGTPLSVALGLHVLLTLPVSYETKMLIRKKVLIASLKNWIKLESIVYSLLMEWKATKESRNIRYKYHLIWRYFLSFHPGIWYKTKCLMYGFFIQFPALGVKMLMFALSLAKMEDRKEAGSQRDF